MIPFPYAVRPGQDRLMEIVAAAARSGGHAVVEAGTGTGKTVAVLAALVEAHPGKVLYLTRTNSQQAQVMREMREVGRLHGGVLSVGLQGRRHMCPLLAGSEEFAQATAEELAHSCADRKRNVLRERGLRVEDPEARPVETRAGGCPFYARLLEYPKEELVAWALSEYPTPEQMASHCAEDGLCPYEAVKSIMDRARVVSAPYIYYFDPHIRRALLDWMSVHEGDLAVVVDEAHNLPEYARQLGSVDLAAGSLELAIAEAGSADAPETGRGRFVDLLNAALYAVEAVIDEYVRGEDAVVPPDDLRERLMVAMGATSTTLMGLCRALEAAGEVVRQQRRAEGRLPRSYMGHAGSALRFWMELDRDEYVRLALRRRPRLEAYCLDPSLVTGCLREVRTSVHVSGTLTPLEEYRDALGLPEGTVLERVPSPFPPENRQLVYVPGLTTRYQDVAADPTLVSRLEEAVVSVALASHRNVAVFFPSFQLMDRFVSDGVCARFPEVYQEAPDMAQAELMEMVDGFKAPVGRGTGPRVLFAVMGGRIAEGLDFPGRALEVAVIVGIPYPPPTARQRALEAYFDRRFGKGFEYCFRAPAVRRMLQAIGRLIRSDTDRGIAVILDKRAPALGPYLPPMEACDRPAEAVRSFFEA